MYNILDTVTGRKTRESKCNSWALRTTHAYAANSMWQSGNKLCNVWRQFDCVFYCLLISTSGYDPSSFFGSEDENRTVSASLWYKNRSWWTMSKILVDLKSWPHAVKFLAFHRISYEILDYHSGVSDTRVFYDSTPCRAVRSTDVSDELAASTFRLV